MKREEIMKNDLVKNAISIVKELKLHIQSSYNTDDILAYAFYQSNFMTDEEAIKTKNPGLIEDEKGKIISCHTWVEGFTLLIDRFCSIHKLKGYPKAKSITPDIANEFFYGKKLAYNSKRSYSLDDAKNLLLGKLVTLNLTDKPDSKDMTSVEQELIDKIIKKGFDIDIKYWKDIIDNHKNPSYEQTIILLNNLL